MLFIYLLGDPIEKKETLIIMAQIMLIHANLTMIKLETAEKEMAQQTQEVAKQIKLLTWQTSLPLQSIGIISEGSSFRNLPQGELHTIYLWWRRFSTDPVDARISNFLSFISKNHFVFAKDLNPLRGRVKYPLRINIKKQPLTH